MNRRNFLKYTSIGICSSLIGNTSNHIVKPLSMPNNINSDLSMYGRSVVTTKGGMVSKYIVPELMNKISMDASNILVAKSSKDITDDILLNSLKKMYSR